MYWLGWGEGFGDLDMRIAEPTPAGYSRGAQTMSTLTRRACYKCGNVGHYAG